MELRIIDPLEAVLNEIGIGLDAIGSLSGIDLWRRRVEPDDDHRKRLITRLRGEEATYKFEAWSFPTEFARNGYLLHWDELDTVEALRDAVYTAFSSSDVCQILITYRSERKLVLSCAQFYEEYLENMLQERAN